MKKQKIEIHQIVKSAQIFVSDFEGSFLHLDYKRLYLNSGITV